jgi:hypothetical protein
MRNEMSAGVTSGRGISNSVIRLPRRAESLLTATVDLASAEVISDSYRRPRAGGGDN